MRALKRKVNGGRDIKTATEAGKIISARRANSRLYTDPKSLLERDNAVGNSAPRKLRPDTLDRAIVISPFETTGFGARSADR